MKKFGSKDMENHSMNKSRRWLIFGVVAAAFVIFAIILIIGILVIRALLPADMTADISNQTQTTQQADAKPESADNKKKTEEKTYNSEANAAKIKTEGLQSDAATPTLAMAKSIVENFLLAFKESDSKRMSNLLVGDAYDKFSGELDAIPYDFDVTEGNEFEKSLFSFKVTTYFKGDEKGPYLEDWMYKVAKTDEGYLKIYERNYKSWTYFTPEM